jgi:hypothetical protein
MAVGHGLQDYDKMRYQVASPKQTREGESRIGAERDGPGSMAIFIVKRLRLWTEGHQRFQVGIDGGDQIAFSSQTVPRFGLAHINPDPNLLRSIRPTHAT